MKDDIYKQYCIHNQPIYYQGCSKSAEELRKEYHKLCRIHHPDKGGKKSMFQRLQNLYERLCNSF